MRNLNRELRTIKTPNKKSRIDRNIILEIKYCQMNLTKMKVTEKTVVTLKIDHYNYPIIKTEE